MSVVEQYARAHVVTDAPDAQDTVPVVLRYDPETDPRQVRLGLPGPHEWTFSRELLERGLRTPAATAEVSIWPCGRVQAVMELHTEQGVSVIQLEAKTLSRFLRRTYMATAAPVAG
ncbi:MULTISPECIES: SsgA family sporulation/cell division regulator [Streptomyces]|jgi:hypothetical protein|uniref:Sporulation/cell division protein n=3 Tax=Streptomyces griseoaurantiacus TaxID=68213 RepID=F3NS81_9ACTN|nr:MULTISPECIES: SsgA family sporulation/cell division regulator [Streptomyces]EGG43654.1 sporulation/cell division protein [Streptomyces griseoaurantiacus M045]MBA5226095.1 SsgA family sporulation/cell division regulator [Streptomyces griseoaurantiacus]MCF0087754.1 Sporulation-specific cell division protein SsgB [Streptomyces sp. MH192]MCF0099968.1 Sporulation-specific cell division protein SsgB [Streptomyces sp. MH191]NJP71788.1 SsgA family sporulation/cell division regulator [Streptomyces s